jgi:hypothetical protein
MVALDRGADRRRESPAADEHTADERVVHAELAALRLKTLLGGLARGEQVAIAGVQPQQYEAPDVVQQRSERELVGSRQPAEIGDPLDGVTRRERVAAKPLRLVLPGTARLEKLVCGDALGGDGEAARGQDPDRVGDTGETGRAAIGARRGPQNRDREAGVGLDRLGHLVLRRARLRDQALEAPARLGESRQLLDGRERLREAMAAAAHRACTRGRGGVGGLFALLGCLGSARHLTPNRQPGQMF